MIGRRGGLLYCRRCVMFSGETLNPKARVRSGIKMQLSFKLSPAQELISRQVLENVSRKRDVLIKAVTGAGKTELVYAAIESVLAQGRLVGFASPRRDVVIDLAPRIAEAFPQARVASVYGGHTAVLEGDIIVLTAHQLYRYPKRFGLLIIDEIDAFPYKGDPVLNAFALNSCIGSFVLLSATPSVEDQREIEKRHGVILTLDRRYHGHPLPVPEYAAGPFGGYIRCLFLARHFAKLGKPLFIFVPTIAVGHKLYSLLRLFLQNCRFVYAAAGKRQEDVEAFKAGRLQCLITTTILERGVTVRDLQVIVFEADNRVFDEASLVQIAGRVGRKIGAEEGRVIFIGEKHQGAVKSAIDTIRDTNRRVLLSSLRETDQTGMPERGYG